LRIAWPLAGLALFYWGVLHSPPERPVPDAGAPHAAPGAQGGGARRQGEGAGSAERMEPAEARRLASLSRSALLAGRFQEALDPTLRLHEAFPTNHVFVGRLANIHHALGRPVEEAGDWEEFLTMAPVPAEACPHLGKAYWKAGETRRAVDAFERCLAFDPNDPDSIFFLAWACERTGDIGRARELYDRGHRISPAYPDISIGLARMKLREGGNEAARGIAASVLAGSPDQVDALLVMGLALQREGRGAEARGYLERGAKLSDTYADFHIALGRLDESEGNYGAARGRYEHVLASDPANREAQDGLGRVAGRAR
jgi:tetratricopeptide (TPR) repeat protein